jgi:hypothetical protein
MGEHPCRCAGVGDCFQPATMELGGGRGGEPGRGGAGGVGGGEHICVVDFLNYLLSEKTLLAVTLESCTHIFSGRLQLLLHS